MKKYHLYSQASLWLKHVPIEFGKLVLKRRKYFDVKNNTYYPEDSHKNKFTILFDQVKHIFKWGFACNEYYIYGLDVKGSKLNDFIPEVWSLDNFQSESAYDIGSNSIASAVWTQLGIADKRPSPALIVLVQIHCHIQVSNASKGS